MDEHRRNVQLVQEAVEQKCADLQPDPFLVEHVLNAADERNEGREKKGFPNKLLFALVMVTIMVVTVSLTIRQELAPQIVAASLLDGEGTGFRSVSISRPLLPASGHDCEWVLQDIHQDGFQYYDASYDVSCVQFISVCRICGKTNGMSYAPKTDESLVAHDWIVRDLHHSGSNLHLFYQECSRCHARWDFLEVVCSGAGGIHISPHYYTNAYWRQYGIDHYGSFVPYER